MSERSESNGSPYQTRVPESAGRARVHPSRACKPARHERAQRVEWLAIPQPTK